MYVCVYIYVYVYIYMYIYTYKIHTHTHKHTQTGLGFCIAGGLQKLEHLTVAARQAAVKAARSEAGKVSNEVSNRVAQALDLLLSSGEGDGGCVCNIYLYIQHSYNIYIHVCI